MTIKFIQTTTPPGKLADVELHFADGPLAGLKLVGFALWERKAGAGLNLTFPARQYSMNGERRSFSLLRPTTDAGASLALREVLIVGWLLAESPADRAALVAELLLELDYAAAMRNGRALDRLD